MKEISIREIQGIKIGHAQNEAGGTGCTAVICEDGACAGVSVRGGGPATRETDLLNPVNMIQQIHCVMLSGGSAYGLAAGDGAMAFLEEHGIGFDVGVGRVPIVCGASLFDLVVGDPKCRPDKQMGYEACKNAFENSDKTPAQGNVGAGTGATVGKYFGMEYLMKSGLGIYAAQLGEVQCAAVVAVNALGDILDYDSGRQIAGLLGEDKKSLRSTAAAMYEEIADSRNVFSGNTTIGCIITNAELTKDQCNKLAQTAHNAYAKVISPVHTSADGDTIFLMSTGKVKVNADAFGAFATEVMGRAINSAVLNADSAYGLKCARDFREVSLLRGKPVAEALSQRHSKMSEELRRQGITPKLAIIRLGERADDISYEKGIVKRAEQSGVAVETCAFAENASEDAVISEIKRLNADDGVHGIMIFRPLPGHIDDGRVREALDPKKDIDGITDMSMAGIYSGTDMGFSPCTPSAVMEILKHYNISVAGKKAVVLGRSLIIGKPVSMMLLQENATVMMCHTQTENVVDICKDADILIVAVGKAKNVTAEYTNPDQIIIDVGINVDENGKLCGDVDFNNVADKCRAITPVPGGVGTVTSSILIKHVIESAMGVSHGPISNR